MSTPGTAYRNMEGSSVVHVLDCSCTVHCGGGAVAEMSYSVRSEVTQDANRARIVFTCDSGRRKGSVRRHGFERGGVPAGRGVGGAMGSRDGDSMRNVHGGRGLTNNMSGTCCASGESAAAAAAAATDSADDAAKSHRALACTTYTTRAGREGARARREHFTW